MSKVVIKIGTNCLTHSETGIPEPEVLGSLTKGIYYLINKGYKPVIVTSGAIGLGLKALGLNKRPKSIILKQASASIGQSILMNIYNQFFSLFHINIAQILLTREDINDRERYLNIRNTFETLLTKNIVPIVNENDVVSVDEIKFGDNDTLSAIVSTIIDADILIILTTTDGVYDRDPLIHKNAKRIKIVEKINDEFYKFIENSKTSLGTGGMETKINAAKIATDVGVKTIIGSGLNPFQTIKNIFEGKDVGTTFLPSEKHLDSRKRWILYALKPKGEIKIDKGAEDAIVFKGKSLLIPGVIDIKGDFNEKEPVIILNVKNKKIGQGLTNFSSITLRNLITNKQKNTKLKEVIHRDNLSLYKNL
ncbi:MAG: glutamate 5-kinase [Caldisericia bacterium]